jgi:hypothetical protein
MAKKVQKKKMACNKPKRTPSHPKKSHVVKACAGGKEKIIRFGVFKWNKTIKEDLKHNFSLLKKLHRSPIYAVHEQHLGNKHKKFLSTFGFVHFADHMDTKGNPIEIYINEEL